MVCPYTPKDKIYEDKQEIGFLLSEDDTFLLQENGGKIILTDYPYDDKINPYTPICE